MADEPEQQWSHGELQRGIERIEADLKALLTALAREYVTLLLWSQRNQQVDDRFSAQGREIGDLRTEVRSRRVAWPTAVAAIAAIVSSTVAVVALLA